MALASRTEYLFSTVCSHLPMGHNLICHSPSHSPMLPLICQKSIYLPKEVSFADFTSHLPRVVSFPDFNSHLPFSYYLPKDCLSFPDRKTHLPLSTLSFSKPSPTFTKRGRKNIFNTPKWLRWTRKSNHRALYHPYRLPTFLKVELTPLQNWA